MRRAVVVLIAALVALVVIAMVARRDSGWRRSSAPPVPGAVTGSAPTPPTGAPTADAPPSRRGGPGRNEPAALVEAREVLAAIEARQGQPLAGYVGGRIFHNREGQLPAGRYREYDVHPRTPGQNRGPERLVIDQATGRAYYSDDHYRTFVPLN
jgi:guanyl-specific ribonuclease Sa